MAVDVSSGAETLLERDADLEDARTALARGTKGEGASLAFVGPAGIGKSALLDTLVQTARDDRIRVLGARGTELERDFAFGVARQLFEPVIAAADEAERGALLEGAAKHAGPLLDPASAADGATSLDPSFGSLHGLYWLTANLAVREPVLIAVDDVQWADRASLRWLIHLAGRLDGVPALLGLAIREPEPGVEESLLAELLASPGCEIVRPKPLSRDALATLIGDRLDGPPEIPFTAACHAATGGNPFLTGELLATLRAEGREPTAGNARLISELGPAGIARSVLARIGRLPEGCRQVAVALAIAGDDTRLATVAALAGLDRDEAGNAADELVGAAILRPTDRLEFAHPVLGAAVRSDLPPRERERLHREAARILASEGADSVRVAIHLLATEPIGERWAVDQLLGAGASAFNAGALEQARDYLHRALRELDRCDPDPIARGGAVSLLGWIEAVSNSEAKAATHLSEALSLTEDPEQRAVIARGLSSVLVAVNRYVEAHEVLDRAIQELGEDQSNLGLRLEGELCLIQWLSREVRSRQLERQRRFAMEPTNVASGLLVAGESLEEALYGDSAGPAAEQARASLFDGGLLAQETADSPAFYVVLGAASACDELDLGHEVAEQAISEASERGSLRGRAAALCWRGAFNVRLGRIEEALEDTRAALEVGVAGPLLPLTVAHLLEALRERGELDEAERALVEHNPLEGASGEELLFQYFRLARIRLRLDQGEVERGLTEMEEYEAVQAVWDWPNDGGLPRRGVHAELLLAKGDRERARQLAAEGLEHARGFGPVRPIGMALRVCGLADEGPTGIELLSESARVLAESPARLEEARALTDLGAAIRRSGRPGDSRKPLNRGLEMARRCGGRAIAERAYEELRAAGAKPRKILRRGVDALTPSEIRVARMAADGRSNKEIAQELFVTVRTVETHLHNAFRKLEIGSRSELADALAE